MAVTARRGRAGDRRRAGIQRQREMEPGRVFRGNRRRQNRPEAEAEQVWWTEASCKSPASLTTTGRTRRQ